MTIVPAPSLEQLQFDVAYAPRRPDSPFLAIVCHQVGIGSAVELLAYRTEHDADVLYFGEPLLAFALFAKALGF